MNPDIKNQIEEVVQEFRNDYTAEGQPDSFRYWPSDIDPKDIETFLRTKLQELTQSIVSKGVEAARREERITFTTILTALREFGSKTSGDLERTIEKLTVACSMTDVPLKSALTNLLKEETNKDAV